MKLNQRGQTSIFLALFIATMVMLFAFTTNIGMLVHAKINLQNAADAAAFAGASVQARQLTSVAYLNYEMRRALKEYLYLYLVRGNSTQACFPNDPSGQPVDARCGAYNANNLYSFRLIDPREPASNNEGLGNYLPTSCMIYTDANNPCQKSNVSGVPVFPGGSFGVADPIIAAVRTTTDEIIQKKIANCNLLTTSNEIFYFSWLANTNPIPDNNDSGVVNDAGGRRICFTSDPSKAFSVDCVDPFGFEGIDSLGFLTRMSLLRARIDNFEETLNMNLDLEGIGSTITDATIDKIKAAQTGNRDLDYFERPVQAFLSAKNNLPDQEINNGIFSNIRVTELIPNRTNAKQGPTLKNLPILAKFNDIIQPVNLANSVFSSPGAASGGACAQSREIRTLQNFPYGISKDPGVLTYYAVTINAKARLLFSPFGTDGTVTLSAYSAAKPFGSRIGKDLSTDPTKYLVASGKIDQNQFDLNTLQFPNILVGDNDTTSMVDGFASNGHLGFLEAATKLGASGNASAGMRLAGAYAPWEVGYFTPPANFESPSGIGLFADNPVYANGQTFDIIAPVLPVNGADSSLGFLRDKIYGYLAGDFTASQTLLTGSPGYLAFKADILSDQRLDALLAYLKQNNGYFLKRHPIPDPLLNDQPNILNWAKANGGSRYVVAAMSSPQQRQLTSWNNYNNAVGSSIPLPANSEMSLNVGRAGYSVRFMSFATLAAGGRTNNDPSIATNYSNPFTLINAGGLTNARLQDDIQKLKH